MLGRYIIQLLTILTVTHCVSPTDNGVMRQQKCYLNRLCKVLEIVALLAEILHYICRVYRISLFVLLFNVD